MKRKDNSRKPDSKSSSKEAAKPRPVKSAKPRRPPPRGEADRTPTNKKRKALRNGRDRKPAGVRIESRHIEKPKPAFTAHSLTEPALVERTAVDEVGLGDTDIDSDEAFELGIGSPLVPPNTQYGEAFESLQPAPLERRTGDVEAQIRALEARLDGLIRRRDFSDAAAEAEAEPAPPSSERRPGPLAKSTSAPPARVDSALPPAEDFIARKWGRSALRSRSEDFDDFGLDPNFEQRVRPAVEFLYKTYFRTSVEGIDNVPAEGRCIVVANHSGALPLDGPMLRAALRIEHAKKRDLRWLAEDFVYYLPFAGVFMNRVGAVRACPENAERLLEKESVVAVFPEGVHGIKKLFRERYHLQRFGRGGYIRLCLRMRAPIIPCAIIGAEESSPLLYRLEGLTQLLGLPYFPITPTFPLLGPAGLLPAPTKWKIRFGEPIHLDSYGPEAADDHVLVGRLSERVRSSIQAMLDSGLRERRSVWFG
ncbi:MAG: lysophospholipid acyltransferase family protein [Polyangiaceae bacterium]